MLLSDGCAQQEPVLMMVTDLIDMKIARQLKSYFNRAGCAKHSLLDFPEASVSLCTTVETGLFPLPFT